MWANRSCQSAPGELTRQLAITSVSLDVPLRLLEAVHDRWVGLLRSLTVEEYRRTFRHPEHGRAIPLDEALGMYAWHGRHHVAHITALRHREGW